MTKRRKGSYRGKDRLEASKGGEALRARIESRPLHTEEGGHQAQGEFGLGNGGEKESEE